jgi:hypothetical protein
MRKLPRGVSEKNRSLLRRNTHKTQKGGKMKPNAETLKAFEETDKKIKGELPTDRKTFEEHCACLIDDKSMPTSLNILDRAYSVRFSGDIAISGYNGSVAHQTGKIILDSGLSESVAKQTVLHEIAHSWLRYMHLDTDEEEAFCDLIGLAVIQLIKHNPDLIAYLAQDDERP